MKTKPTVYAILEQLTDKELKAISVAAKNIRSRRLLITEADLPKQNPEQKLMRQLNRHGKVLLCRSGMQADIQLMNEIAWEMKEAGDVSIDLEWDPLKRLTSVVVKPL